jgi:hypothetical protein
MNSPAVIPDSAVSKRQNHMHLDSTMYEASAEILGAGKDEEQEGEIKIQTQESPQRVASRDLSRAVLEQPCAPNEESELGTRKISCEEGLAKSAT